MIGWYSVSPACVFPGVVRIAGDDPAATEADCGNLTALQERVDGDASEREPVRDFVNRDASH